MVFIAEGDEVLAFLTAYSVSQTENITVKVKKK